MRRLMVHADGYGFAPGINRAIEEVLPAGFVQGVSINANFPATQDVTRLIRRFPRLSCGIHLNLSVGRPVSAPGEVPSLVGPGGEFWYREFPRRALRGRIRARDVAREIDAQIARLRGLGVTLSHWDSHRGDHIYPPYLWVALDRTRRAGIPAMRTHRYHVVVRHPWPALGRLRDRVRRPRTLVTWPARAAASRLGRRRGFRTADRALFFDAGAGLGPDRLDSWLHLLGTLPPGTSEVWCHPGYPDDTLRRYSTLLDRRIDEARALASPRLARCARRRGVTLIGSAEL
jgi:chitin disaccharide deacetylase